MQTTHTYTHKYFKMIIEYGTLWGGEEVRKYMYELVLQREQNYRAKGK